jgi:hypothetical protein
MPKVTRITESDLNQQMRNDYEKYRPCLHVSVRVSNLRLQRALERQAKFKGVSVEQYCEEAIVAVLIMHETDRNADEDEIH